MRLIKLLLLFLFITAYTIPSPKGYVNDYANIIEEEHENEIETIAIELKNNGIAEIAVLTVRKIEDGDITDYTQRVFDSWEVGEKGKDNGLLIVLSLEDRKIRINTGYGLEEILPDGLVGEIIDINAIPYFKEGRYGEGILQTVTTISQILKGEIKPIKREKNEPSPLFIIAFFILIVAIKILSHRGSRRGIYYYGGRGDAWGRLGGFNRGGFGGFGGGLSGGGGAGRSW